MIEENKKPRQRQGLNDNDSKNKKQATNVQIAIAYATKYGWSVFPVHTIDKQGGCSCGTIDCKDAGKHPMTKNGFKDASNDPEIILKLFHRNHNANIGIVTGAASGIEVIDVDPRNRGDISIEKLIQENSALPITLEVNTGGGGKHFYFQYSGKQIPKNALPDGIDFQSDGKYIIAPPSQHLSGKTYDWVNSKIELNKTPEWLFGLIKDTPKRVYSGSEEKIPTGKRNSALASIAGLLRLQGLGFEEINESLQKINSSKCEPPLSEEEVKQISESISKYTNGHYINGQIYKTKEEIDQLISAPLIEVKMQFDKLPEPAKDFLNWSSESTHGADEFIILGFIGAVAACMGNEIVLNFPSSPIKPNVWLAGLGRSSRGKTTAFKIAGNFLDDIDKPALLRKNKVKKEYDAKMRKFNNNQQKCDIENINYDDEPEIEKIRIINLPPITSIQKLAESLSLFYPGGIIYVSTELAIVLSDWKRDRNDGLAHFYMALFDSPSIAPMPSYKNSEDLLPICDPVVSIVGASTQKSFFKRFNEEDFESGMLQRWCIGISKNDKPKLAMPKSRSSEGYNFYKEFFRCIFDLKKILEINDLDVIEFQFSPEAKQYWCEQYYHLNDNFLLDGGYIESCFNRIDDTYILKFALIFECAKQIFNYLRLKQAPKLILSKESIEQAITLSEYFKESLLEVTSKLKGNGLNAKIQGVVRALRRSKNKVLTMQKLRTLFNAYNERYEAIFDEAIHKLEDLKVIHIAVIDNDSNNNSVTELVSLLEQ